MDTATKFLRTRRSVRRFADKPVTDDLLMRLIETATWAPSAHHRQPWRFVVLRSEQARQKVAIEMGNQYQNDMQSDGLSDAQVAAQFERSRERLMTAPAAAMLCLDVTQGDDYPDEKRRRAEHLMGVQSVALAGLQLLLAAHAQGLGGVWTCGPLFAPEAARRALGLPKSWEPQALIFIGYPEITPPPRPRKPVDEVVRIV